METQTPHTAEHPKPPVARPRRNGRRPRRRWWILGLLALAVVGGGYKYATRKVPDDTKFTTATRRDIRQTVTATGAVTLQTTAEVKVGAEVSGKVRRLLVDVGDRVSAGQLLVQLENPETDAILSQAQANVDAARARVGSAQSALAQQGPQSDADVRRAQAELRASGARLRQRQISATAQPASTEAEVDRARASLRVAEDALAQARESAEETVKSAEASLDAARAQQEKAAADGGRAKLLFDKGYISRAELDAAVANGRVAAADVSNREQGLSLARVNARHAVDSARGRVDEAQALVSAAVTGRSQIGLRGAELEAAREDVTQAQQAVRSAVASTRQTEIRRDQVREAEAGLRQAEAEYRRQQQSRAKMTIRSPMTGIVTSLETKEGETITAGFQTPTLVTISNLNRMQVEVPVDETDVGRVRMGMTAKVTVDAFPTDPLPGHVIRVAASPTVQQNVVTYNVTVALDRVNPGLRPRMTATVAIDTGLVKQVVALPLDAVKQSKDSDVVYTESAKKAKGRGPAKFERKEISTGASDEKFIEVKKGLKPGDKVILSSSRLDVQRRTENL